LLLQKRVTQNWNINFTCLRGIDKASKDIATDLSKLFFFIADIYGEGIIQKDNAEAGVLAITKQTTKLTKKELH
jgi:hypothetical protein